MRISDWSSDVGSSDLGDAKPDEELLELAETLIQKKTAPFDASVFHDRYIDALKDLVQRKLKAKGGKVTPEEEPARPSGSNVVDLMAAPKKALKTPEGRSEERRVGTECGSKGHSRWTPMH